MGENEPAKGLNHGTVFQIKSSEKLARPTNITYPTLTSIQTKAIVHTKAIMERSHGSIAIVDNAQSYV